MRYDLSISEILSPRSGFQVGDTVAIVRVGESVLFAGIELCASIGGDDRRFQPGDHVLAVGVVDESFSAEGANSFLAQLLFPIEKGLVKIRVTDQEGVQGIPVENVRDLVLVDGAQ